MLTATRLTPVEFDALLITFKYHWDEYYSHFTLEGKVRQRISYTGRPVCCLWFRTKCSSYWYIWRPIPFRNSMLFCLRWHSPRLIDEFTFFLRFFGVHWKRLVNCQTVTPNVWYTFFKDAEEVLLDGTERPIQRPLDEDRQSACYSGKKTHSIKNTCYVQTILGLYSWAPHTKVMSLTKKLWWRASSTSRWY